MSGETTQEVLRRARKILATATLGLRDVEENPERRLSGLHNLVVFGRAVTNVLQNLRSTEQGFDNWYAPLCREMVADDLMRFFYKLRSRILKEGDAGVSNYAIVARFDFPDDLAKFGPPPPSAKSFFIGDNVGGSGWEVEIEPGVTAKFYVDLPSEVGTAGLYFRDAPGVREPGDVVAADIFQMSASYLSRLERIVQAAEARFSEDAPKA